MLKNASTSLIVRGVLALIVGVIAIAWPSVTILALVILFAVYAFLDAGLELARAFSSGRAGPVIGHLLLALLGAVALRGARRTEQIAMRPSQRSHVALNDEHTSIAWRVTFLTCRAPAPSILFSNIVLKTELPNAFEAI